MATTEDVNAIIAQRDKLQMIVIERDMTIEHLLSKVKEMTEKGNVREMPNKQQLDDRQSIEGDLVQSENGQLGDFETESQTKATELSVTKSRYEQMRLKCSLLKDINESLMDDNENLKIFNRILESNYDILRQCLERVQSEHKLRLSELHDANEVISKSLKNSRTNKRVRSDQHVDHLETPQSHNKRRRFSDTQSDKNSQIDLCSRNDPLDTDLEIDCSSAHSISNITDNDFNGNEENDRSDLEDDVDDDLEFIPTEPICIDLTDEDDDRETDNRSNNSSDDSLTDDDPLDQYSFIKPFSQYSMVKYSSETSKNQSLK